MVYVQAYTVASTYQQAYLSYFLITSTFQKTRDEVSFFLQNDIQGQKCYFLSCRFFCLRSASRYSTVKMMMTIINAFIITLIKLSAIYTIYLTLPSVIQFIFVRIYIRNYRIFRFLCPYDTYSIVISAS